MGPLCPSKFDYLPMQKYHQPIPAGLEGISKRLESLEFRAKYRSGTKSKYITLGIYKILTLKHNF
jgi:hypothetical protein